MQVLVVDDQVDIVKGIIQAIDWDSLGVSQVFSAFNIQEAKKILGENEIPLMLCDIEMPMGTGIELFKWVKDQKMKTECIFLTAHAEFEYAQEAIKLGSFDYILQPAPYEEIQKALSRMIESQKNRNEMQELSDLGQYWKKQKREIADAVLKRFLLKKGQDCSPVLEKLNKLGYKMRKESMVLPILIHLLDNRLPNNEWDDGLIQYALDNVICEIYGKKEDWYFSAQLDSMNCAAIFILNEKSNFNVDKLEQFINFCVDKLHFHIACYAGCCIEFEHINQEIMSLYEMEQNNVIYKAAVYTKKRWEYLRNRTVVQPDMEKWEVLIRQGCYNAVKKEADEILESWKNKEGINIKMLECFYQDFIQMFIRIASQKGSQLHDFFIEDIVFDKYVHAYHSVEDMQQFISYAIHFLEHIDGWENEKTYLEKIQEYVHEHIDEEISRSKLAEELYISPEYLSRLFKKEKGITLSDYIILEKMSLAYSYIQNTDMSVSDIAVKTGYKNFSYFSQAFKKIYHESPMQMRRNRRRKGYRKDEGT